MCAPELRSTSSTATSRSGCSTLSLHDALPIWMRQWYAYVPGWLNVNENAWPFDSSPSCGVAAGGCLSKGQDRKSTRLNSSHVAISYAVFCLKKKTKYRELIRLVAMLQDLLRQS